jgi:hypothetical protein
MAICAGCDAELPEAPPLAERPPCPFCGSKGRKFFDHVTESARAGDHIAGQTQRDGRTIGYSESSRQGTTSSADIEGERVVYQMLGESPQGELDTMETVRRFLQWLNRDRVHWGEPSESSALHTDAMAEGIGDNVGSTLFVQVVRAITDSGVWHQLSTRGEYTASLSFDEAAEFLWLAVQQKAGKIKGLARGGLVLLLDANRCPGQAFPAVVEKYRRLYATKTRELGFGGVYVVGPLADSIAALDS